MSEALPSGFGADAKAWRGEDERQKSRERFNAGPRLAVLNTPTPPAPLDELPPGYIGPETADEILNNVYVEDDADLKRPTDAAPPIGEGVERSDFQAFMPGHAYIFVPTGELWPASSVNSRIPLIEDGADKDGKPKFISAAAWLDRNRPVEQMTWCPGLPKVIYDRLVSDGGWIERKGVACFNLYRPPTIGLGDASKAGPWLKHVRRVYPNDADHILNFLAHRVQRPHEKINHAIVLGGKPGIGKDTILEPVKRAVGPWNFQEVSPKTMLGRFNGFVKCVILRISEARDLGDVDRYQFYETLKVYCAAPPDVLRVDEKNLREYGAFNCCGVIITTNHKADGLYLPPDDRRTYVAWSELSLEDFSEDYWQRLWGFYEGGGDRHIAEYLRTLDISGFNPKAPPLKTPAFWEIVDANRAPEDAELSDVIDRLGSPDAITLDRIVSTADAELGTWLRDRKSRRMIPHRLEDCGYVPVRNDGAKDGLWKIGDRRQAIYAKADLSVRDRIAAANELVT
jgi:Family of unknown function (DUF5906)